MSQYTNIEGEEGRKVDFYMEIGMDAAHSYFSHATVEDVVGAIEACEDHWPSEKLDQLIGRLAAMASEGRRREGLLLAN
jgi:hypothetical protein